MHHLIPWLSLKSVPGVGNLLFNRLLACFKTPEAVFEASKAALCRVEGINERIALAIRRHQAPDQVKRDLDTAARYGYQVLTLADSAYPAALRHIPDPPPVLYVYGRLSGNAAHISMVGSRKASTYGLTTTRRLCEGLAAYGITVVSGMARGIDTAAHQGAMAANGRTVAVLGTGLRTVYPPENVELYHRIAENGAVISEFTMHAKPEARHFPIRNRIISGLSLGTVVIEAARRSGSLITARLAAEQGREVFAVPGSIHSANTQGPHRLIQQGAKLVHRVDDILEEIKAHIDEQGAPNSSAAIALPALSKPSLAEDETKILENMDAYPVHVDELARRTRIAVGELTGALVGLELKGLVFQEPGNIYTRNKDRNEE